MTEERELLVAYADGELDDAARRRVEAWTAQDDEARALLEALQAQKEDLASAFDEELRAPLPPETLALFSAAGAAHKRPQWWQAGIAAGLAAALFGGLAAYGMAELRTDQLLARYEAERQQDRVQLAEMVQQALEKSPSGQAVRWGGAGDLKGEVLPLRTFRNQSGDWCREYSAVAVIGIERLERRAIACRSADGAWETRVERDREIPTVGGGPAV
jgi:surface antigen